MISCGLVAFIQVAERSLRAVRLSIFTFEYDFTAAKRLKTPCPNDLGVEYDY